MLTPQQPRHIDLHLPHSWNQCSTEELEHIAACVAMRTAMQDRYHPFSWEEVKVQLIFLINNLEIVEAPSPANSKTAADAAADEAAALASQEYIVRFAEAHRPWYKQIHYRIGRMFYRSDANDDGTFALPLGYIPSLVENLSWLDDEKAEPLLRFPYPTLTVGGKTISGATTLLDGYTWQEYRHLQDWMQLYIAQSNVLARRTAQHTDAKAIAAAAADVDHARAHFLATLFRQTKPADTHGADPQPDTALFAAFDPIRWQVILFWWSGLMKYLIKTYPRCFKADKSKSRKTDPLNLYSRTTATLQKYVGLTEQEVNAETYTVTLRKLEMMAEEADEAKRINQKYNSKGKH